MPKASLSASSVCHNCVVIKILSLSEIMPLCSHCDEKGLVYITIALLTSHQPSSCVECTKVNMHFSCNVCSASNAECALLISLCNLLVPYLIYCKVSRLDSY